MKMWTEDHDIQLAEEVEVSPTASSPELCGLDYQL